MKIRPPMLCAVCSARPCGKLTDRGDQWSDDESKTSMAGKKARSAEIPPMVMMKLSGGLGSAKGGMGLDGGGGGGWGGGSLYIESVG